MLQRENPACSTTHCEGAIMSDNPFPLIFDSHLDLAWNAIDWNRDLRLSAADIRKREIEQQMNGKGRGEGTVSFV